MDATRSIEVEGYYIPPKEVEMHGALKVASNRLKGSGIKNPTKKQIEMLARSVQKKIPDHRGQVVTPSVPRF